MKYLFGPINSRRLGRSLGVDLMPYKTCTLDCVYCECGATTVLASERREYVPTAAVIEELRDYLTIAPPLDVITFSGGGEPTLHSGISTIIEFLKQDFPRYRVAVLTNGTLLWDPAVRKSIMRADMVVPSLDAADDVVFARICRQFADVSLDRVLSGLIDFRREYRGVYVLEVFIVPGINDGPAALQNLKKAIMRIRPDRIELNSLDRPGTAGWVRPATRAQLEGIQQFLQPLVVEIIARRSKSLVGATIAGDGDIRELVVREVRRRPATLEELAPLVGVDHNILRITIEHLVDAGRIEAVRLPGGEFYRVRA